MAELWSDFTDFVITNVDKKMGNKYKVSLRNLLSNPSKYASQADIQTVIKNMTQDVDSYVDQSVDAMPDESKKLDDALKKADSVTKQLSSTISMQCKQNKVPLVKPVSVDRDRTKEEAIFIDSAGSDVVSLAQKLIEISNLIADFSYQYRDAWIGSWLFSGKKNYTLNVYMPDNDVALLEASRNEITALLNGASAVVKGI